MLLVTHIIIALASVVSSTFALFAPSQNKVNVTYGLTAATVASGTFLVISTHAPILQSCITGLLFVLVALAGTVVARQRLVRQEQEVRRRR